MINIPKVGIGLLLAIFSCMPAISGAQDNKYKGTIYFFPGQGSDERLFEKIDPDSAYTYVYISYPVPDKKESLHNFAQRLSAQIDTTKPYVFIGVSMGGMIISELCDHMHPEKAIIISSAKCREELPFRYKFQKAIPLYKIFPAAVIKGGAKMLQPIVEPDRKKYKSIFKSMLSAKNKLYMKRSVGLIINWNKNNYSGKIIHIHGTKDHTLPLRKVKCNYVVQKGSHMMALTRGEEINELIKKILSEK